MDFPDAHYIMELLPDISHDEVVLLENKNVSEVIDLYLNRKRSKHEHLWCRPSLEHCANCIIKLFPNLTFIYVFELLTLFCDLPNKVEIVLRILNSSIIKNEENSIITKRGSSIDITDFSPHKKIRKLELPDDGKQCNIFNLQDTRKQLDINTITQSINSKFDALYNVKNVSEVQVQNGAYDLPKEQTNEWARVSNNENNFLNPATDQRKIDENYGVAYLNKTLNLVDDNVQVSNFKSAASIFPKTPKIKIVRSNKPSTITSQTQEQYNYGHINFLDNFANNNNSSNWISTSPKEEIQHSTISSNFLFETTQENPPDIITERSQTQSNETINEGVVGEVNHPLNLTASDTFLTKEAVDEKQLLKSNYGLFSLPHETQNTNAGALTVNSLVNIPEEDAFRQDSTKKVFHLIKYIAEFTKAPSSIIRRVCKNQKIKNLLEKPEPHVLNVLCLKTFESLQEKDLIQVDDSSEDNDVVIISNTDMNLETNESTVETNQNTSDSVTLLDPENLTTTSDVNNFDAVKMLPKDNNCDMNLDKTVDFQLVNTLCAIFSDACPNFIKELCGTTPFSEQAVDKLATKIFTYGDAYPKRTVVANLEPEVLQENQLDILKEFLPDADPDFLTMKFDSFEGKPDKLRKFLDEAMEKKNYPKMKDYLRRQQLSAQQKQYLSDFTVENFVKIIPDCETFFEDKERVLKLEAGDAHYALVFLRNMFNKVTVRIIQNEFAKNEESLSKTIKKLKSLKKSDFMKTSRKPIGMPQSIQNIPLLQEIAYYSHEKEIKEYIKKKKEEEIAERKEAIEKGIMKSCSCCYDEEVLPRDIFSCDSGCEFCKSCILKSTEVLFGEGKLQFPCLADCGTHFNLQTLQAALSPKLFSKIAQKKALEEIKEAGISELEFCPFCDFATIPAEGYSVFTCLNPDCMKESCRSCKEPSHIPLHCDEIEKDQDVQARTYVENKMTEALLRKCLQCGLKFFKEEGCNKMTCSCGAQMCYVCGKAVTNYQHFNGNGGDRLDLCPLYSDTNVLNQENVLKGAETAKAELGAVKLKYDPTLDVKTHYKERARKNPQVEYMPPHNIPIAVLHHHHHRANHLARQHMVRLHLPNNDNRPQPNEDEILRWLGVIPRG